VRVIATPESFHPGVDVSNVRLHVQFSNPPIVWLPAAQSHSFVVATATEPSRRTAGPLEVRP
jgi:hypothetical protein